MATRTHQTISALEAASRLNEENSELEATTRQLNAEVARKDAQRLTMAEQYKNEEKVVVMGAPMYAAWFGKQMPIILNCIPVYVPLDGNRYKIPASYACEFNRKIREVNEQIELQKKLSRVTDNFEKYPGQRDLIQRV